MQNINQTEARERIAQALTDKGVDPKDFAEEGGTLYLEIGNKAIFGSTADVYVREDDKFTRSDTRRFTYRAEVNWGSTGGRSVSSALNAVTNYQRAIEIAAAVDACANGFPIVEEDEDEAELQREDELDDTAQKTT